MRAAQTGPVPAQSSSPEAECAGLQEQKGRPRARAEQKQAPGAGRAIFRPKDPRGKNKEDAK